MQHAFKVLSDMNARVLHQHMLGAKFSTTIEYVKDTIPSILWLLMHPILSPEGLTNLGVQCTQSKHHKLRFHVFGNMNPPKLLLHIPWLTVLTLPRQGLSEASEINV